ncbi:MAG: hypothetical protein JNG84_09725 [Archangium sp.]|nr:hypothetical protein [Archangium sp.]
MIAALFFVSQTEAGVRVRAHITKKGTSVPAHIRTAPDTVRSNNWSTTGNANPYTGKRGTKRLK